MPAVLPEDGEQRALITDGLERELGEANMEVRVFAPEAVGELKRTLALVLRTEER